MSRVPKDKKRISEPEDIRLQRFLTASQTALGLFTKVPALEEMRAPTTRFKPTADGRERKNDD